MVIGGHFLTSKSK